MPILLTTPFNPGDLDPGNTYPRAKVVSFTYWDKLKNISLALQYGDIVDGVWVKGAAAPEEQRIHVVNHEVPTPGGEVGEYGEPLEFDLVTDFDDVAGISSQQGEVVYDTLKRGLYEWLLTNIPALSGTIE